MSYHPEPREIRAWAGDAAYQRGARYAQQGRVLHPRRMGNTLKALCQGQAIEPYRVEIHLGENSIVRARCTCPVGGEGRCKHVAAVLVHWRTHPEAFRQPPPLATHLQNLPPDALVRLILRMVERYPDLAEDVWLASASGEADTSREATRTNNPAPHVPSSNAASQGARGET